MIPRYFGYIFRSLRERLPFAGAHWPRWTLLLLHSPRRPFWGHFSRGMEKIPHLDAFLGGDVVRLPRAGGRPFLWPRLGRDCRGLLAWGLKEGTGRAAGLAAEESGLPLLRLEDGFLRSLDLGVHGAAPCSIVVDGVGIYYDSTRPSALENLLNSEGWQDAALMDEARAAMAAILANNLSKYNHAPDAPEGLLPATGHRRILVLDQTYNDLSVRYGGADDATFASMLEAACAENPDADIYVKTHPDVLCGRRKGYFPAGSLPPRVRTITTDASPASLLRQVDEVYCATSQMGFEALMLGRTVHCFGMPFYAGWGLTRDRQACPRRTARRSLEEVFAAAYILYSRYVHPVTGKACRIMDIIRLLAVQRECNNRNRGYHACLGFRLWKHEQARAFLASTRGEVAFFRNARRAVAAASEKHGRVVVWSSKESAALAALCRQGQVPLLRMEDGFLRSRGLGSDFTRPGSLVLDDLGIYYNPQAPSRLERMLATWEDGADDAGRKRLLACARALREELCASGITKYNVGDSSDIPELPKDRTAILVPGQVEDDASVRMGGCGIRSNLELLRAVRAACPHAFLVYKEHPDVVSGNREGALRDADVAGLADAFVRHASIRLLYDLCDEVHTLTSQSGFEALLRGRKVVTYGGPFYAGWGFTTDRQSFPRRRRLASLDILVAAVLLLYPRYYDWKSRCFTDYAAYLDNLKTRVNGKKA